MITHPIEHKNFHALSEEINEFCEKENVKATKVFYERETWFALLFYEQESKSDKPQSSKSNSLKPRSPATKPQRTYLEKNKLPHKKDISKQEAYQLIKEHKKKHGN